ncbi:MAG TPA: chemotaxis protein CheA, partial [Geobacteraceae bacterium]
VNAVGELLSSVPSAGGAEPGSLCFDMLFASTREPASLSALLGSVPVRVDAATLLAGESAGAAVPPARPRSVYRIRFTPRRDSLRDGTDPLAVIDELRWLGDCYVVAQTGNIPGLEELEPENCYVSWDLILATDRGIDEVRDVFIYVEEGSEVRIELVDDGSSDDPDNYKRLGEILVERGDISAAELKSALIGQKPIGELLVASHLVQPDVVESALVEQQFVRELRRERQPVDDAPSLRVPAQKLDLLVNLVGEMVTVQARLSQSAGRSSDPDLLAIAEEVERLTAELRDTTLNIRMLPIGTTFTTFKRLVRTLAKELGKDVQLTTVGGETELDKTVIERLNDPFVHLIRNCIDHGIEAPDARAAAGKPRQGTVHLAASHSGDSVQITISDDGAGLDRAAIRARGVERGLIHPASELGDRELYSLIFAPGFSTATTVTDVSGRGVGMDVVKRSIDALRGTIDITSQAGQGTAINIRLPLTLAIIESLLVSVGTDRFVLPLPMVEECVELTSSERRHGHGDLVDVRGQLVPYIPLRERFAIVGEPPPIEQVVIARVAGERVGIVVDHVIGEHQAVIKSLGQLYRNVRGVSGATVLGDGTLALIVDVPNLLALERDSRV